MNWRTKWVLVLIPLALAGWGCAGGARAPTTGALTQGSCETSDDEEFLRRSRSPNHGGQLSIAAEAEPRRLLAEASPEVRPAQRTAADGEADGQPAAGSDSEPAEQSVSDTPSGGPLLIYTADINLAVHEVREKIDAVIEISDDIGGFLQAQNDTSVIIRIPASRFRDALSRIEALGDVLHRRVAAQDVSEQVRDIRIRLQNAVQMRDRLAALLERAETVPDSLTIERELERLTQTIEQLRGQLRSFDDQIAYSTITIRFAPIRINNEVPRERFRLPFPWLDELGLVNLLRL